MLSRESCPFSIIAPVSRPKLRLLNLAVSRTYIELLNNGKDPEKARMIIERHARRFYLRKYLSKAATGNY